MTDTMRRTTTLLVAALVVVGTLAAVPATGLAQTDGTDTATPDGDEVEDGNATAPGDLLEGVVGVQEAEVEGEIENRAFGIRVARAATDGAKADVVAERLERNEERIAELEDRREDLEAARENGTISEAEYRNGIARLAVESRNAERLTTRTGDVSEGLPADLLEERGVNATAVRTLSERADRLTGPEVAEIARSIAGRSAADDASERRGPSEDGADDDRADDERGEERQDDERSGAADSRSGNGGSDAADGDGASETGSDENDGSDGDDGADEGGDGAPSGVGP